MFYFYNDGFLVKALSVSHLRSLIENRPCNSSFMVFKPNPYGPDSFIRVRARSLRDLLSEVSE